MQRDRPDGETKLPWALRRAGLLILFGIISTTLVALGAVFLAPKYVPSTIHGVSRATLQNSLRETGLKLAAGIAAGFAAILAWGRLVLSSKEHENAVSSQITERYTKAVDQLGNNDPGVRLGGLYALERIALDSERDRPTICQVLSAYVRYHTSPEALEQTGRANPNVESLPKPALLVDVRAALSILTVPDRLWKVNIDLSNADLRGALLSGSCLAGADLAGADLRDSHLEGADLTGTGLRGADLRGADLRRAHFLEADLTEVDLTGARYRVVDLLRADLTRATGLTEDEFDSAITTHMEIPPSSMSPNR